MDLDFCGENLASTIQAAWCNGGRNDFLAHTGHQSSNIWLAQLIRILSLTMCIPCMPLIMTPSSMIMCHVTKRTPHQSGPMNMTMSTLYFSSVPRHQISIQWCTFGMRHEIHCGFVIQNHKWMYPTSYPINAQRIKGDLRAKGEGLDSTQY